MNHLTRYRLLGHRRWKNKLESNLRKAVNFHTQSGKSLSGPQ